MPLTERSATIDQKTHEPVPLLKKNLFCSSSNCNVVLREKGLFMEDPPRERQEFSKWLKATTASGPIEPDEIDFENLPPGEDEAEAAGRWRVAQFKKLIRLYSKWKAGTN